MRKNKRHVALVVNPLLAIEDSVFGCCARAMRELTGN